MDKSKKVLLTAAEVTVYKGQAWYDWFHAEWEWE